MSEKAMTIVYEVGNSLYVNLTNKCPCSCTFCIRQNGDGAYGSDSLWLEHEPSAEEIKDALKKAGFKKYNEIIFCGYGEPTERIDILVLTAEFIKKNGGPPVRLNTNGLSDLINKKPTAGGKGGYGFSKFKRRYHGRIYKGDKTVFWRRSVLRNAGICF